MPPLFKTILVPHDGSDHAARALRIAADVAQRCGGRLVVLRAIAPFLSFAEIGSPDAMPWVPPQDVVAEQLAELEASVRKSLRRRGDPEVECRVVVGDAYPAILDAAAAADLVVMATHGRTGLEHLVIGSVAEKVVRHSPAPVLTIRREAKAPTPREPRTAAAGSSRRPAGERPRGRRAAKP
jgi:nucleotide-binding universal stress UspA family protein